MNELDLLRAKRIKFGKYIRDKREKEKISLRSVASKLGITAVYLGDIERGNRNPPQAETIVNIARLLRCNKKETYKLLSLAEDWHDTLHKIKVSLIKKEKSKILESINNDN